MAKATLTEYFEFSKTARRLELLPTYNVKGDGNYRIFIETGKLPPRIDGWPELLERITSQGKTIERVRYIPYLSDYIEYELEAYKQNVRAGEKINFIKPEDIDSHDLDGVSDFWIFDDIKCIEMNYSEEGHFLGFTEIADDQTHTYLTLYQKLKSQGKDISEYYK